MSISEDTAAETFPGARDAQRAEEFDSDASADGLLAEFREMALELYHHRELLWQMVLRDLRIRYKQAVMGVGWAVFMPIMVVCSGIVIKFAMAQLSGTSLEAGSVTAMVVKAMGWAFVVGSVGFAVGSLTNNMSLVTKIYFPREVFPVSAVLTQVCDSAIGTAAMVGLLVLFVGLTPSWAMLWTVPLVLLVVLLSTAAALITSCANVFFRDVKYIVQVLLTFGIFFTPVFYEAEFLGPLGCRLMMLNPLAPLLEGLRLSFAEGHNLLTSLVVISAQGQEIWMWTPWDLLYSVVWTVMGLLGSWWIFHRLEYVYPEYI